jgi:hypothetical protein
VFGDGGFGRELNIEGKYSQAVFSKIVEELLH